MCGQQEPVRASRAVSVRELGRAPAALLDEVEWNGEVIVLTRHGRMAALVTPIPDRTVIDISRTPNILPNNGRGGTQADRSDPREPAEPDPEWLELTELQRAMLLEAFANYPMPFSLNHLASVFGVDKIGQVTHLETDGYVERTLRGNLVTRKGAAAARWLARSDPAPSS